MAALRPAGGRRLLMVAFLLSPDKESHVAVDSLQGASQLTMVGLVATFVGFYLGAQRLEPLSLSVQESEPDSNGDTHSSDDDTGDRCE